jgi:TusA-related sulfurtransferase
MEVADAAGKTIRKGGPLRQEKIDRNLDLRGIIAPLSLLMASHTFRELKPGETVQILGSDPDTRTDLFKVLPASSYEVIYQGELKETDFAYCIRLKKTEAAQHC